MPRMTTRSQNILDAAEHVFLRYGVKRSSMADIASEAGISRQTLYKSFRSKDDILAAHIRAYAERAMNEIEAARANVSGLAAQLDLIFDKIAVAGFEMVRALPHAQALDAGFEAGSREELARNAQRYQAVIAEVLAPHAEALGQAGLTPEGLAEFVQRAARAAKGTAQDRADLLRQLATLRQLCLRAAGV